MDPRGTLKLNKLLYVTFFYLADQIIRSGTQLRVFSPEACREADDCGGGGPEGTSRPADAGAVVAGAVVDVVLKSSGL